MNLLLLAGLGLIAFFAVKQRRHAGEQAELDTHMTMDQAMTAFAIATANLSSPTSEGITFDDAMALSAQLIRLGAIPAGEQIGTMAMAKRHASGGSW